MPPPPQNRGLNRQIQLPETTYEQREQFYEDVESMLNPGFLSHSLRIGNLQISMRSPSPGDLFVLRQRASSSESEWVMWSLSSAIWMVNGTLLLDHVNNSVSVYRLLQGLPRYLRKQLFYLLMSLWERSQKSMEAITAFCYEDKSRLLWRQLNGTLPNDERITGLPGTSRIGMNYFQRMWVAFNQTEDQRQKDEARWNHTKFVASVHNPKYVKKVESRDKSRLTQIEKIRQQEMDYFYYRKIGVLDEDDTLLAGGQLSSRVKTVEDLANEYQRWVTQDWDEHDRVVEAYKQRIRDQYEEQKRLREQEWQELQRRLAAEESQAIPEDFEPEKLQGFTAEELREKIQSHRNIKKVYDDTSVQREYVFREHLSKEALPPPEGGFVLDDEGRPIVPGSPRNLNDRVRNRNPKWSTKDD